MNDDMEEFDQMREDDLRDQDVTAPAAQRKPSVPALVVHGWHPEPRRLEFTLAEQAAWEALKRKIRASITMERKVAPLEGSQDARPDS